MDEKREISLLALCAVCWLNFLIGYWVGSRRAKQFAAREESNDQAV